MPTFLDLANNKERYQIVLENVAGILFQPAGDGTRERVEITMIGGESTIWYSYEPFDTFVRRRDEALSKSKTSQVSLSTAEDRTL